MEDTQAPPRVTALIVARDRAADLRRCLSALEASHDRAALEVLVVDSGSRDDTPAVAAEFPNITTLRLPKHFGRTKALNIGIRTAKGDFVFLIDPGVEVAPDTISRLLGRIAADDAVGAVCPYVETAFPLPDPAALAEAWRTGRLPGATPVPPAGGEVEAAYPAGAPMLVRRLFLKGMNYLDERFGEHWADLELCRQLRGAGKKILVLPEVRVSLPESGHAIPTGAVYSADCAIGAGAYVAKHFGWAAGFRFRLAAVLHVLGRVVTFRQPGYNFRRLNALVAGSKIDGTQK